MSSMASGYLDTTGISYESICCEKSKSTDWAYVLCLVFCVPSRWIDLCTVCTNTQYVHIYKTNCTRPLALSSLFFDNVYTSLASVTLQSEWRLVIDFRNSKLCNNPVSHLHSYFQRLVFGLQRLVYCFFSFFLIH